jgi:acetolactate synthase-1/3 small subunit
MTGDKEMRKQVLSILVENTPSVLSHVAGLFSRRGYNIDSISAGVTADPRVTRITIVTSGDELILDQIEKQVAKLEDVLHVQILDPEASIQKELMLVKLRAMDTDRQRILSVAEIFHGKVVDVTHDSLVIEVTGNQDKLTSFLNMLDGYEILELARTGLTGLTRGTDDVYFVD